MEFPAINGFHYSWASVEISIAGDVTRLIKEISYSVSRDRGIGRGTTGRKTLRTKGDDDFEASITFYREGFEQMLQRFGEGWGDREFEIVVNMQEDGRPFITDTLKRCLIDSAETGGAEGPDASEVSCDLNVMDILFNGKRFRAMPLRF